MRPRSPHFAAALLAAALGGGACSSPPTALPATDPEHERLFPTHVLHAPAYAQARFEETREDFGVDLVEAYGIVPIFLELRLAGEGAEDAQVLVSPDRMGLHLFLEDGTPVPLVPTESVGRVIDEEHRRAFQRRKFRGDLLQREPTSGYVFFQLSPRAAYRGSERGDLVRETAAGRERFDVGRSLVAFELTVGGARVPFRLGVER